MADPEELSVKSSSGESGDLSLEDRGVGGVDPVGLDFRVCSGDFNPVDLSLEVRSSAGESSDLSVRLSSGGG